MAITKRALPAHFLIVPSNTHFFGPEESLRSNALRIVHETTITSLATLYFISAGAIGFHFLSSGPLGSIDVLDWDISGEIPQAVIENNEKVIEVQLARMDFANFVSAAFLGRVSAKNHRALTGASFVRLDEIASFQKREGFIVIGANEAEHFNEKINAKAKLLLSRQISAMLISSTDIEDASSYIEHLMQRSAEFNYANLQSAMTMNYQAAILHNQQHMAASFALNFSVIECLVKEIFYAYGLLIGHENKFYSPVKYECKKISEPSFEKSNLAQKLKHLNECKLIDVYLYERISKARQLRNSLMHSGKPVTPKQSGECQTAVRDLWALLIERPFELNASWTYRY